MKYLSVFAVCAASLVGLAAPAGAQTPGEPAAGARAPTVVVTATRLDPPVPGATTTLVTAEQIENSPGRTIPEILSFETGIRFQDLFGGNNSSGQTIDIRGFGEPATANTLILINGRRLSDLDLAAVDFASIPRHSIERIEITRGAVGSVLYGGGAQGGVINVITKSGTGDGLHASVDGGYGADGFAETTLSASVGAGGYSLSAYGNALLSDGYRDNNELRQKNLSLDLRKKIGTGEFFVHVDLDDQFQGLPGGRIVDPNTGQNDLANPRGAQTPLDFASENGIATYIGGSVALNDSVELLLDASVRHKDQLSDFRNQDQSRETELTTWGLTPRLLIDSALGGRPLSSTVGVDLYYVDYDSDRKRFTNTAPFTRVKAYQHSTALYAQNTLRVTPKLATTLGFRVERISFSAGDVAFPGNPGSFGFPQTSFRPTLSDTDLEYALNFGLEYEATDRLTFYGHVARGYRTPTLDERSGTAFALNTFELQNQSSKEIETGSRFRIGPVSADARIFFSRTKNEIRFDPDDTTTFGANENIDPVHRYGFEGSVSVRATRDLTFRGNLTVMRAEFAEGAFEGNDVPLVPNYIGRLGASWKIAEWLSLDTTGSYESRRHLSNDEGATFRQLDDFALWDVKLHGGYGALKWSASVNNLLDEDYQTFGVASDTTPGRFSVQTLPGRNFMLRLGARL